MKATERGFYDPEGTRHGGTPTYPWGMAPPDLATRDQLAELGLTPGRQDVAAQILWRSRRYSRSGPYRVRFAYLYRIDRAVARRPASVAQLAATRKATAARRVCRSCGEDVGYVIPRSLGECLDCADDFTASIPDLDWSEAA